MNALADRKSSWCEIGLFILEVEKSRTWQGHASTFTSWLDTLAARLDVQRTSLWKYRAAVLIGIELTGLRQSDSDEHIVGTLKRTKADMLETLHKIAGIVPKNVSRKLIEDVMEGRVSRTELRAMWKLYKNSELRTGHQSTDSESTELQTKPSMLSALMTAGAKWLEDENNVSAYKVYSELKVSSGHHTVVHIDGVVAVKRSLPQPHLELHGIVIAGEGARGLDFSASKFCNYLWCLSSSYQVMSLPEHVGLLTIQDNAIHVVRRASPTGGVEHVALCAQAVLLQTL